MDNPGLFAVIVALVGIMPALATMWVGRRQRAADLAKAAAEREADRAKRDREIEALHQQTVERTLNTVNAAYEDVLEQLQASVSAANQRAKAAEESARMAAEEARDARADAWAANQRAREMARFLVELRPLIQQYVPGAADYIARLDQLAVPPPPRAALLER